MKRSSRAALVTLQVGLLAVSMLIAAPASAQTWAEKLGWSATDVVLIRHADDAGMFPTGNDAIQRGLLNGEIDSASAMAPVHFFDEMAEWSRNNPSQDVGLHLTLTSEWDHYKWGPSAIPPESVKRILDRHLLLKKEMPLLWLLKAPTTVGREIQAQINSVLQAMNPGKSHCIPPGTGPPGWEPPATTWKIPADCLAPTHVDSHMGVLYMRRSYFRKFIGRVLKNDLLPLTFEDFEGTFKCMKGAKGLKVSYKLFSWIFKGLEKAQREYDNSTSWPYSRRPFPRVDRYCALPYGETLAETRSELVKFLDGLEPGITMILFHPTDPHSLLDVATRKATVRTWDAQLFGHPDVQAAMAGIKTTNWRDMTARCASSPNCP